MTDLLSTLTELMQGSFSGCKSLDISGNSFVDEEQLLSLWIRHDMALRRLDISCLSEVDTVSSILDAVAGIPTRFVCIKLLH